MYHPGTYNAPLPQGGPNSDEFNSISQTKGVLRRRILRDAKYLVSYVKRVVLSAPRELVEAVTIANLPASLAPLISKYAYGDTHHQVSEATKLFPSLKKSEEDLTGWSDEDKYFRTTAHIFQRYSEMPCYNHDSCVYNTMAIISLFTVVNVPIEASNSTLMGDLLYIALYAFRANRYNSVVLFGQLRRKLSDLHYDKNLNDKKMIIALWESAVEVIALEESRAVSSNIITFKELVTNAIELRQTLPEWRASSAVDPIMLYIGEEYVSLDMAVGNLDTIRKELKVMMAAKQVEYRRFMTVAIMYAIYSSNTYPEFRLPVCAVCGRASTRRQLRKAIYCSDECANIDTERYLPLVRRNLFN